MSLLARLRNRFQRPQPPPPSAGSDADGGGDIQDLATLSLANSLLRRRRIVGLLVSSTPILSRLLIVAGFLSALVLPTDLLSRGTYISENALQPGQVNTYWEWPQVHVADRYADSIDLWRELPSHQRADAISSALVEIGLPTQTQSFAFHSPVSKQLIANGTNVYAVLHAPRTDGSEALVLMASWLSRRPGSDAKGGDVNVRGVASVLALAKYLSSPDVEPRKPQRIALNLWSKDIIFLFADGFVDGTHAWLQAYHELPQSNLQTERLRLRTGPIWAALNIDYPFHSFSHLALYYEGINGQLPNLDLINTAAHITRWTGSCPVTIHDVPVMPDSFHLPFWTTYSRASQTMLEQMSYGLLGTPSGPEGIFTPYRIDAISLFAVPANGPHGFHTLGKIVESTIRSLNNLLERFHQSFFLYLIQNEKRFISVANYLFVPLVIGAGLTLLGLSSWGSLSSNSQAEGQMSQKTVSWPGEQVRGQGIVWAFKVIGLCHLTGAVCFWTMVRAVEPVGATKSIRLWMVAVVFVSLPVLIVMRLGSEQGWKVLEPIHLLLVGCLISVVSVLNFALGAGLALLFGPALGLAPRSRGGRWLSMGWYVVAMGGMVGRMGRGGWMMLERGMFDDQCLGGWWLVFVVVIVLPLMVEGVVVEWMSIIQRRY